VTLSTLLARSEPRRLNLLFLLSAIGCATGATVDPAASDDGSGRGGAAVVGRLRPWDAATSSTSGSGSGGAGGIPLVSVASSGSSSSLSGSSSASSSASAGGAGSAVSSSASGPAGCGSNADCDDGVFCNGIESCVAQLCASGEPPVCDDGVSCTTDHCDPSLDACRHDQVDAACDDGTYCNGSETCAPGVGDPVTGCAQGSSNLCDDGVACTTDACDETKKECAHQANDPLCNDGIACNGIESCSLVLGCVAGASPLCDDGVSCTLDFCDGVSDACAHVPQDQACDDATFCNGAEHCNPAVGCEMGAAVDCDDSVPCTTDSCSEPAKACAHSPVDAACDDGAYCDGIETCDAQIGCLVGTPVICDDGRSCTADMCNDALSSCTHTPVQAACDDGIACNGYEVCNPNAAGPTGCVAGPAPACASDGIACTVDHCTEPSGTCEHTAEDALCPAGLFCVAQKSGCVQGAPCSNDAQCDDKNACNGSETCVDFVCTPGAPLSCGDGVGCTVDACDPATGACSHVASDALCDNGLVCDGLETCSASSGCQPGVPIQCDDGVGCTFDFCSEPNGSCIHGPIDALCDDGVICNGAEVCTPSGCGPGAPFTCPSDGVACTKEVCNPNTNACEPVADDSACPCGQTCDLKSGCGNTCVVATCQGKVYACGDCLDNDGDCKIDSKDPSCLGPCDNTENSYFGGIPGQNNSPCKSDCYFDSDTGAGNDQCYWSHACDPHEVAPLYSPEGDKCSYDPNANISGTAFGCVDLYATQSATCTSYCGPLVPNGCDCFGCCTIPGAPTPVWLGSENPPGTGSCTIDTVGDPTKCKPCEQVPSCLNTCETCEICVGKPVLPPACSSQICPAGKAVCGQPGQPACPLGQSCITGCCTPNPL